MAVAAVVAAVEPEGVPCGPINSMEQVFSHPQVHARDMVAEVDHPTAGRIKYGSGAVRVRPLLSWQRGACATMMDLFGVVGCLTAACSTSLTF